jgi:hypothetical protein
MALGKKTGGRQKGSLNKHSAQLKDMILGALSDVGGQQYLAHQARENPNAFISLIGRTLPLTVNANHSGGITITIGTDMARVG